MENYTSYRPFKNADGTLHNNHNIFFIPKEFLAVAFDSGGVASGPMTATFLLPLCIGACETVGGNIMTDAFGVVSLVAAP